MDDLISRQAAIAAVGHYSLHSGDKLLFADAPLKALPTVDPPKELICSVTVDTDEIIERIKERGWNPVKHGRWIYGEDETIEDGGWCSVCHRDQPTFWVDKAWRCVETRYCPHCGAKMYEVEE